MMQIAIKAGNAAFLDADGNGSAERMSQEACRLLRELADGIGADCSLTEGSMDDANGNEILTWNRRQAQETKPDWRDIMMKVTIKTGNAAFCDPDGNESIEYESQEVCRLLRVLADDIEADNGKMHGSLNDANGNKVLEWSRN